jgi:hypothetical protein
MFGLGLWELILIGTCLTAPLAVGLVVLLVMTLSRGEPRP